MQRRVVSDQRSGSTLGKIRNQTDDCKYFPRVIIYTLGQVRSLTCAQMHEILRALTRQALFPPFDQGVLKCDSDFLLRIILPASIGCHMSVTQKNNVSSFFCLR